MKKKRIQEHTKISSPQKGTQLKKRAPIMQDYAYRIIIKIIEIKVQRETRYLTRDQEEMLSNPPF